MGLIQSNNNRRRHYRVPSSPKLNDNKKYKRIDGLCTTMRSITLRALASRTYPNSVSSSYDSNTNHSSCTSPTTLTTINSQLNPDSYLSDFDYRKLSTLTGLSESKVNELHREFLILSHNGRLTFERYKSMLENIPNYKSSIELDKLARQTFSLFDKDGNNYLDFAEFIAAYIIMEKNEFSLNDKSQRKESPTLTSVTREATTYYPPQQTLVNTSPRITRYSPQQTLVNTSPRITRYSPQRTPINTSSRPIYYPHNYTSYYYPQSVEQYIYGSSQYKVR